MPRRLERATANTQRFRSHFRSGVSRAVLTEGRMRQAGEWDRVELQVLSGARWSFQWLMFSTQLCCGFSRHPVLPEGPLRFLSLSLTPGVQFYTRPSLHNF